VEVHPAPEKAISDGAQSLDIPQFQKMMKDLEPYIQLWKASRTGEAATVAG
jgi:3-deoxy-7-phosphoheptulonate synthase